MRIRATVAAVTGALTLSALVVPVAQAASADGVDLHRPSAAEILGAASGHPAHRSAAAAQPTVTSVSVNGGRDVVLGTTTVKTFTVSVTATHASGIADAYIDLWHGSDPQDVDGWLPPNEDAATCKAASATKSTCTLTITARAGLSGSDGVGDLFANFQAGSWHVAVGVWAKDKSAYYTDFYKTHKIQRLSKLTVNAAPEPVKKGATITVTGKLTRADWQTRKYVGIPSGQSVSLQFRKAGSSSYSTVKGIKTTSGGALKTTVKAASDGYHRFNYKGITSTAASVAAGDYVDVK
jgi:hypothetical protein